MIPSAQIAAFADELCKVANIQPILGLSSAPKQNTPEPTGLAEVKPKKSPTPGKLPKPTYSKVHSVPTQSASKGYQPLSAPLPVRS